MRIDGYTFYHLRNVLLHQKWLVINMVNQITSGISKYPSNNSIFIFFLKNFNNSL